MAATQQVTLQENQQVALQDKQIGDIIVKNANIPLSLQMPWNAARVGEK